MTIVQVPTKELGIYLNALSESFILYRLKGGTILNGTLELMPEPNSNPLISEVQE